MQDYLKELYFDEPIQYRSLLIYPVKMKDYLDFHFAVNCLLIDKNSAGIEAVSMSYLKYMYYLANNGSPYLYMFNLLLHLVLKIDMNDNSAIRFYTRSDIPYFSINGMEYDNNDLEHIIEIIFNQNCIDKIDNTIQKEIRDAFDKAKEYKMKQNNNKICSLEDQMICVLISTPLKFNDIYELTIRKFEKILARVDAKLHYQIYLQASMSGMVKFKDESVIQHWMNDLTKQDKYSDVKVDMDEMRNKVENINK